MKWDDAQKAYYQAFEHTHLDWNPDSVYAANIVEETIAAARLKPGMRVLEVGAGSGRFTLHLLRNGLTVTALDLSQEMLDKLGVLKQQLSIGDDELTLQVGSLHDAASLLGSEPFDAIAGFFLLHHLDDAQGGLEELRPLLKPGGQVVFIEPNRINPLFFIQIFACGDMSWKAERGTYRYGAAGYANVLERAGFSGVSVTRFGFFPPPILDRARPLLRVEKALARVPLVRSILPLLLLQGTNPA